MVFRMVLTRMPSAWVFIHCNLFQQVVSLEDSAHLSNTLVPGIIEVIWALLLILAILLLSVILFLLALEAIWAILSPFGL